MPLLRFFKTTILGGLMVLLPVAVGGYVIAFFVQLVLRETTPLMKWLGLDTPTGYALTTLAVVATTLALCFMLGLIVQTALGRWIGQWIEFLALNHLPGYQFLKNISHQALGRQGTLGIPVSVQLGNARQLGFLIEENADGSQTVFVPLAPALTLGSVYFVPAEQVKRLDIPFGEALNCVGQLGYGSGKVLAKSPGASA